MRVSCFISYAHRDRPLCEEIVDALGVLEKELDVWYDRSLVAGDEFTRKIEEKLKDARLVLLLVTGNFLSSTWAAKEVRRALFDHDRQRGRVIPLILRDCAWQETPFAGLQALPAGGRAVEHWPARTDAIADIVAGVARAAAELGVPARSSELVIFESDDLREMIEKLERSIGIIRRANSIYPVMPTPAQLEVDELQTRLKKFQTELVARGELL
jgi:hypothetical protein